MNPPQDIAAWLESLGMADYVERFVANRIDPSVLPDLTDQDLKDLGVLLGDRRKLLRAISELALASSAHSAPPPVQDTAERRHLTVMFCDLAGSTALSTQLDPEDLRHVIGAYHRCCAATVESQGGFVAKYMGDGVLVYFGYPQAHEHDAEHAVRTGLALIDAVPKLVTPAGSPLQVRVGIATGVVVVGDLVGSGEAQERGVVGETPNLAARLQGLAAPNTVILDDGTRKLLGNLFKLDDLGQQDLKGIAGPVRAWSALEASAIESRFEALRTNGLKLVGREKEIDLLMQGWSRARAGNGHALLLCGEAGIGKSRLTATLLQHVAAEPHAQLRFHCSPQHARSAFHPIIDHLERAGRLSSEDPPQTRLDKLQAMLASSATPSEDAALFAEMLSLPNDGRYPALTLTPQQRRQRTLDALANWIETQARTSPAVLIFEDAHWSDPTSLEVLGHIIDRVERLPLLLIVTFRPEFVPPWTARLQRLTLGRLAYDDVGALIDGVAGAEALPAKLRQDILQRADGIPLFIEEMTKAVLEASNEGATRQGASSSPALAVPASLHASLMARLDRLGDAKEVAQIGAAIGREFSVQMLALVARKGERELASALDRLARSGLLLGQGEPPHASYLFNHALVQDAAYGTLLRERRRSLHARIAATFEQQFADVAESQPEVVALHYTEAGLTEHAARLWGKAGQRALARSALKEAADHLARAVSEIAELPSTAALREEQITLQIGLANALIHTKGHASAETKAAFEKARTLIETAQTGGELVDDPLALFSVLYGFWVANRMAFNGPVALALAAQFMELAEKAEPTAPRMIGHLLNGISLILVGRADDGRTHLDRAIALYDPAHHRTLATRFGHDVRMTALIWRAMADWMLGYPDAAARGIEDALKDAHEIGHAATSMFALSHAALARTYRGGTAAAARLADELVALAESKGSAYWQSYGLLLQGQLELLAGKPSAAVDVTTSAIAMMRSTGATAYAPWYLSFLAKAHAELGNDEAALRLLGEAVQAAEATGEQWATADIHRIAGEIALIAAELDGHKAEQSFQRALGIAREQKAKSFELRAGTSLARLWLAQGRRREAQELLAPIVGWFGQGFDTSDMIEARRLLDEMTADH